jgi:hypothetical protein
MVNSSSRSIVYLRIPSGNVESSDRGGAVYGDYSHSRAVRTHAASVFAGPSRQGRTMLECAKHTLLYNLGCLSLSLPTQHQHKESSSPDIFHESYRICRANSKERAVQSSVHTSRRVWIPAEFWADWFQKSASEAISPLSARHARALTMIAGVD